MEYFIPREQKKTVVKHRGTAKKKKKKMQHATLGFVTRKESSLLRERERNVYIYFVRATAVAITPGKVERKYHKD